MEAEETLNHQLGVPESDREGGRSASRRWRALLFVLLGVVFAVLSLLVFSLTRNREAVRVLYNPEQFFDQAGTESGKPLEGNRDEILTSLNEELDHSSDLQKPEENRLLAQLDRLWRSFKRYLSPTKKENDETRRAASGGGNPSARTPRVPAEGNGTLPGQESFRSDVLDNVLRLARDPDLIQKASLPLESGGETVTKGSRGERGLSPVPATAAIEESLSGGTDRRLYRRLQPMEGVRTRGVVWQLHRNLSLEGTLDTTQLGESERDLRDFGLRSVDALGFLRDNPRPSYLAGWDKIDSGYPRSYGIGINLRVSREMQMLFDYSREYPNDHLIEYKGDWESSLMADYAKKRQDEIPSVHSFFFGLRYLHREKETLLPFQTGFFYSTNMAQDPLPSDVSVGFSLGGGVHRKDLQLGISYRLRIWENPDPGLLALQDTAEEELSTRISNQVLFYLTF